MQGEEGVHLPPKELHVLRLLLGSAGSLISKEWLLDQVWSGCDVAEESLTRCIYVLRKLLGPDSAYIKTVYGKGYRFTATVTERTELSSSLSSVPSLLVLPLHVQGDDCFDVLHCEIVRKLALAFGDSLCVIPVGMQLTGDCLSVVERLMPDYYLSVRGVAYEGGWQLSLELCRSSDHALLHGASLMLVDDREVVLQGVVSLVAQRLPGLRPVTLSCESYPLALSYLNGLLALQAYTACSVAEALVEFLRCVQLDASYVPPWCGLADVYLAMANIGSLAPEKALVQARRAVARALALEPGNVAATMRLALLSSLQGVPDAAEALFRPALLGSDRAGVRYFYAWHQWCLGAHERALQSIEISLAEDPASIAALLLRARIALEVDHKRALAAILEAIDIVGGGHEQIEAMYALVLDVCGDSSAALSVIERAALEDVQEGEVALIACYVRAASDPSRARQVYERWRAASKTTLVCPAQLPVLRRLEGDFYAAQHWQELAHRASPWQRARLGDPRLRGLGDMMLERLQA
ncbi:invasion protein regulator [Pseudomonas fluorescens]|nr:invasion protein regulator [Pseudomonas fluorescens]